MKNKFKVIGIIAIITAIALVFAACGGKGGTPAPGVPQTASYKGTDNEGNTYELVITENLARAVYSPQKGDTYELIVNGRTSKGLITAADDKDFTLTPYNSTETVIITISGGSLAGIIGKIIDTDGGVILVITTKIILLPPNTSGAPSFPVIYRNGAFMDGVSVKTGDYTTYTGSKDAALRKGKVTLKDTYIEVTPAQGQEDEKDDGYGHFKLEFTLQNTLDLSDYDGIEVVMECEQDWVESSIVDATGKTQYNGWDANTLVTWLGRDSVSTDTLKRYFTDAAGGQDDGNWALDISDFTYKIKGFSLGIGVDKNEFEGTAWKIKSVRFIKAPDSFTITAPVIYDSVIPNMTDARSRTNFGNFMGYYDGKVKDLINAPASVTVRDSNVTVKLGKPKELDSLYFDNNITITPNENIFFVDGDITAFLTSDEKYVLIHFKDENNFASLIYADKEATIIGQDVSDDGHTHKYNLTLKKGWNYAISSISNGTITYTASQTPPSGYKWFVADTTSNILGWN